MPRISLAGTQLIAQKRNLSFQDDRLLDGVVCRGSPDVDPFALKDRLQRAARQEERARLARELHDGLLQSLTGAALQLQAASRLVEENPHEAGQRLREIGKLLAEEQRTLRAWIEKLKPAAAVSVASEADLATALEKLRQRVERHWGLCVLLIMEDRGAIPGTLGDEVYRLVQEALTNVARHAGATIACVELEMIRDGVCLTVTDDGRGFPFRGRYDLAMLTKRQIGPVSLKERVASLYGELVLTTTPAGSCVEISLPLDQRRMPDGVPPAGRTEPA